MKRFVTALLCAAVIFTAAALPASAQGGTIGVEWNDNVWSPTQTVFTNIGSLMPLENSALVLNRKLFDCMSGGDDSKMSDQYFDVTVQFAKGADLVDYGFDGKGNYVFSTKGDYNMTEDGVIDLEIDYIHINYRGDMNKHIMLNAQYMDELKDASGTVIREKGKYLVVSYNFSSDGHTVIPDELVNSYGQSRFDIGFPVAWVTDDSTNDQYVVVVDSQGREVCFGAHASWLKNYQKAPVFLNSLTADFTVTGSNYATNHAYGWGKLNLGTDDVYTTPTVGNLGPTARYCEYQGEDESQPVRFSLGFTLRAGQTAMVLERTSRTDTFENYYDVLPEMEISYIDFVGTPVFNTNATLFVNAGPECYLYEYLDGGVLKKANFKWDEDSYGWVLKTRTLGDYLVSSVELMTEDASQSGSQNPDTGC